MSGTLLRLQLSLPGSPWRATNYQRFVALAAEERLEVRPIEVNAEPGAAIDQQALQRQLESAQAFWLAAPHLLGESWIRTAVESRLAQGAVMIAEVAWSRAPRSGDGFLQDLGVEATSIRASAPAPASTEWSHPMLVVADRSRYELGFRDTTLFKGVGRLLLQQANGIGCFGEAQTVLALSAQAIEPLDMRSDFYIDLPRPELPVIATSARVDWRGRVVALHAGLLHDAYRGPFGATFPGIEAFDNRVFARNLLRLCAGAPKAPGGWEEVYRLVRQLESALARWTCRVLVEVVGNPWFELGVPEEKRRNAPTGGSKRDASCQWRATSISSTSRPL